MSRRDAFVHQRRNRWSELEILLSRGPLNRLPPGDIGKAASLYRDASADLMQARALSLGTDVTTYLDTLVSRGHSAIYGPRTYSAKAAAGLLLGAFPATLRKNSRLFAVSCALFFVPLAVGWVLARRSEAFALGVLPKAALEQYAEAYAKGFDKARGAGMNSFMAGFYVHNNVGIAFRCFATGVLFGAGPVFFLFYNGVVIGTTIGFVARSGAGANMLEFMCGHAPFELTAIVISGTAGLRMGLSLIITGGRGRLRSLRDASRELGVLVLGAAAMLLVAACVEGYWSPSGAPRSVKYAFSALGFVSIVLFLWRGGRRASP